ncbi:uncharacterized protein LOC142992933, partial [Genypterus blacodes]|uniref:uncharacterized protein LOC142992933 n=1 Tax=Genypterus blacodes TaxID=154954 RepID=UPI003F76086C
MASASVVGQHPGPHRLDSEPQLLMTRLPHRRKKITLLRKTSREKLMYGRSSGAVAECTGAASGEFVTDSMSMGSAGETATRGGRMPCEGCGALLAPAAPRSLDGDREAGGKDCVRRAAAGSPESPTGRINCDHNRNLDCHSNRNTGGRSGAAVKRSDLKVMSSASVANGHKRAHPHRDRPHGSRDSRCSDTGQHSISSGDTSGLPLERLTQGRTGVVRLARAETPRREAWSIFPQGLDPRVRTERGEGHRFAPRPVTQDWCDVCSRQITAQTLKCQNCSYTCHLECENQVQLDCNQRDKEPKEAPSAKSHSPTPPQAK